MHKRVFLVSFLITLSACASKPERPMTAADAAAAVPVMPEMSMQKAVELENAGQHLEAATMFNRLADAASSPQKQHLRLRATQRLMDAGAIKQAKRVWQETDIDQAPALNSQHALLGAKIAVADRDADGALKILAPLNSRNDISPAEVIRTRIAAYDLQNNIQQSIFERIKLEQHLSEEKLLEANQHEILRLMSSMQETSLNRMAMAGDNRNIKGWAELALILKQSADPIRRTSLVNGWRSRYPDHTALLSLISSIAPQQQDTPPDLRQIALLLPFEGNFSNAAEAVKNGFLTAFYQDTSKEEKPVIRFYDTSKSENIIDIYQQAVSEGATIVVGPLNKQSVEKLAQEAELPVPTLVLNHLADDAMYKENLFQFGLSPEEEARQVAHRAWNEGRNNVAVVFPEGNWGSRVSAAFITEWETLGGVVVSQSSYSAKKTDFKQTLTSLLNIDKSNQRHQKISQLLRTRIKHEPRRRQDIDFIFMAAFPKQARLIPPQLKFHHAGDLPVYTTSHSYTGKTNRRADRDMNGVIIGDMPWTLFGAEASPLYKTVSSTWAESSSKYNRLYALGVDAFNVLYYLNWLRSNPTAELSGSTGTLHMNLNSRILRELSWAKFVSGRPKALKSQPVLQSR